MQFQPKDEREIRDAMLLPAGEYDFEVASAADKISKTSGNEMIELKLRVFHADGSPRMVTDYLVSSMELKLNRFCNCVGLGDAYQTGELDAYACEGMAGRCKLGVEQSEQYGDKNTVKDYLVPKLPDTDEEYQAVVEKPKGVPAAQTKAAMAAAHKSEGETEFDKDCPF